MNIMEEKANLYRLLADSMEKSGVSVRIGSENDISGIRDCSLITTNYNMGSTFIGSIGVIGPTRMEYPRVISSMNYIRKMISQEISKLFGIFPSDSD